MSKLVLWCKNSAMIYQVIETGHLLLFRDHFGPVNLTENKALYSSCGDKYFLTKSWTAYTHLQSVITNTPIRLVSIYSFEIRK